MHNVKDNRKMNLPYMIFQDLVKVVDGVVSIIQYGMHLSYMILQFYVNVNIDPSVPHSKKHTVGPVPKFRWQNSNFIHLHFINMHSYCN
ncbi:hypothetical protein REPUB_Repub10bG0076200 [Reevesia pubescens]